MSKADIWVVAARKTIEGLHHGGKIRGSELPKKIKAVPVRDF